MAAETVNFLVVDGSDDPIEGVLIRCFDSLDAFVTQNFTAVSGICEVTLDGDDPPESYTIRLSKNGVAFDGSLGDQSKTPQTIDVYTPASAAPLGSNAFELKGEPFILPAATDPRLCRCTGFFRDGAGRLLANLDIHIISRCMNNEQTPYQPLIVDGNAVLQGGRIIGRTDSGGKFQVDLYRGAEYGVLVQGHETQLRSVHVPDQTSVNLVHLLFPFVTSIVFDPSPLALAEGAYQDVIVTVTASDKRVLDLADGDVVFSSDDETVATVSVEDSLLRVFGRAPGTAQVVAERADSSIVVLPDEPSVYSPLAVTVS